MNTETLPPTVDLGDGITCIDTLQGRAGMACCYLLQRGRDLAFIEAGTAHGVPHLLALLKQRGLSREQVRYVIPTHVHLDHAGGAGSLMAALPAAQLVAHPRGARHLIDPSKLIAGATAVYGEAFVQAQYGEILPIPASRVIEAADGHEIRLGDEVLRFFDSPGHARHHFCVFDPLSQGFFTGDTFGLSYREFDTARGPFLIPTTTPVQFEPEAWHATLDRLLAAEPRQMFLTHFGRVRNVKALAATLRQGIDDYVRIAGTLATASDRHAQLREAITTLALQQLQAHGCTLDTSTQRDLLAIDMELNAQGLGVWLDQTNGRPGA